MLGLSRKKREQDIVSSQTADQSNETAVLDDLDMSAEDLAGMVDSEGAARVGSSKKEMIAGEAAQAVSDAQLDDVRKIAQQSTTYTSEADLLQILAEQVGMEVVKLHQIQPQEEALKIVNPDIARQYKAFPISLDEDNVLTIAISDPLNVQALDDLRIWLDHELRGVISSEEEIINAIDEYYGTGSESVDDVLNSMREENIKLDLKDDSFGNLVKIAHEAPIVKLVNLILLQAIKERASDLHVEPMGESIRIRYRADGILHETVPPPQHLRDAILSRFKVMAGMNIAERRLPQDGRVKLKMDNRNIELRVSTLPTVKGESVVMRILDSQVMSMGLENIGMMPDTLELWDKMIRRPNGIVLVTGPTGCGKTTTMYSSLSRIFSPMVKMITTENPVEYQMDGIVQVNINANVGLTFARCLRAILRQDPDIIMVGEIRDLETAKMAIESSLTGHLVLSTMHTNDACGTLTRLIDMDVEPFLITSAVVGIMAQRLIRKICDDCKEPYKPDENHIREMGFSPQEVENITFFHGKGCTECHYTGYKGRIGVFELLALSEPVKEKVLEEVSSAEIFHVARKEGLRSLREDGWEKVIQGITTIEEVLLSTVH